MKPPASTCFIVLVAIMALTWLPGAAAAEERYRVVIGPAGLEPPVLEAVLDERVAFVNRSNRIVHLEFIGDAGQHEVFQVPGRIWATFRRPGRHPYVVHVTGGSPPELRGAIDVAYDPRLDRGPAECPGITVMEICIER